MGKERGEDTYHSYTSHPKWFADLKQATQIIWKTSHEPRDMVSGPPSLCSTGLDYSSLISLLEAQGTEGRSELGVPFL
jgi:hypothetical protein